MLRIAVTALLLLGACTSSEFTYVPAQNASATMGGRAAADYAIPENAPAGDVRLATYGVAELQPRGGDDDQHVGAIHLRLAIANNSDHPWTIDTRQQRLDLEGRGMSAPALASADRSGDAPPVITVAAGGKRTVDLFFPLPKDLDGAKDLPAFDAVWRVSVGPQQTVVERTPFERIVLEEPDADYAAGDYGDVWPYWYDPYYAGWGLVLPAYWGGRAWVHGWGHPNYWHGGGWHGGGGHGGGGFHGGGGHGGGHR